MKISPKYEHTDWKNLGLTPFYDDKWVKGADIIFDRIHGRYLAQIDILENNLDLDILEYSGFLIMAVDCMVIETSNQFYFGIKDTNQIYNRKNRESYRDFFLRSRYFKFHFDEDKSFVFYDHVRNGLLHQAQTKKKTLINVKEIEMIKKVNPLNINDGIIVNRKLFHEALLNEFYSYVQQLKTDNPVYNELRKNCINKMDTIC